MTDRVMGITYPLSLTKSAFVRHEAEMFANNTIEGLVHFEVIHRKSRHEIYPYIDKLLPLSRYIKGERVLSGKLYRLLLESICRAVHSCGLYLLDPKNICLTEGGVYIDDGGFSFIYIPGSCDDNKETDLRPFFRTLTGYVDDSDEGTVNLHQRLRFLLEQHGDELSVNAQVTVLEKERFFV